MSGLMARIRSRRADGPPTTAAPAQGDPLAGPPAVVAPDAAAADGAPDEQATVIAPAVEPEHPGTAEQPLVAEPPAGAEPAPPGPSFRDRSKLRRRLRYLRRVRELGFRDLGGLVFDLDRFGRDRPELVRAKLDALGGVDRELRALEAALAEERDVAELHEPGIAACAHCGAIHGSEANFCPACGRPANAAPKTSAVTAPQAPAAE